MASAAAARGALAPLRHAADIVHLLAAATWLGALVLFLAMLRKASGDVSTAALSRVAGVGSMLVAVLVLTGVANLWAIIPPTQWAVGARTPYGALFIGKLALFAAMFALAALNRFVLVPTLTLADGQDGAERKRRRLRISIARELCAGLSLLVIVSKLSLLDPN